MKKFLKWIFDIEKVGLAKRIKFMGLSFKFTTPKLRMQALLNEAIAVVEKDIHTAYVHQNVFPKYKNIHTGKTIVLCGAAPSLTKYEPIEGAVHIALNSAVKYDKIKFDYIFVQDWKGIYNIADEIVNYKGNNCKKFIGTQNGFAQEEIPETVVSKMECERFITDNHRWAFNGRIHHFTKDLATQPLGNFGSIAFPAMQFALWTNPAKIYIVGCDAAPSGHIGGDVLESHKRALNDNTYAKIVGQWKEFKEFAEFNYPGIEIISVNPVGLKGLFKDIYTE